MFPAVSFTYLCAMLASNEALQHVSYPTQVLGKSIKPVPVMLFGVFIARKRYHLAKYAAIIMIVLGIIDHDLNKSRPLSVPYINYKLKQGIVFFMHQDKSKPEKKVDDPLPGHPYALIGFGEALLLISLAMDGLTGAIQDKMNANHRTDTHTMMYNMNVWSCVYLFVGTIFSSIFTTPLFSHSSHM